MTRRLVFTCWDKNYNRKGQVGKVIDADVTGRHNTLGSCDFTVSARNNRVADLSADGARVTVDYYPDTGWTPIRFYSGEVENIHGEGRAEKATRTFTVTDDWNILNTIIGWPKPASAITAQTDAYYVSTGPAETVVKDIVGANATRAGIDLTVPASAGLGDTVTVKIRMHPEADRLFPAVDQAGIGVRVVQVGDHRELQVYAPTTYPRVLTEDSKIIQGNSFDLQRPRLTRVVVGAGGEGTARAFKTFVNAAREAQLGTVMEQFIDARDVATITDPEVQARVDEAMAENAAKASMDVTLVERGSFRFGKTFHLGDQISVQPAGLSSPITDLVRAVQITKTTDAGVRVTPMVGDWAESTDAKLQKIVAQLAKSLRDLKRR